MLTLARSVTERGELVLLRRADGALELRVNGMFAMDTAETSSERVLATASLDAATESAADDPSHGWADGLRVLVGGLGLGFTVAALLDDPRVVDVVVAEIEPALVRWHRSGVVPRPRQRDESVPYPSLVDHPAVHVVMDDVRACVARQDAGTFDLVLLDVDNGPGFLLHDANAAIYRPEFLQTCARVVRPGGVTAIWSASESAQLAHSMRSAFASADWHAIPVLLNRRRTEYHLYIGRTTSAGAA